MQRDFCINSFTLPSQSLTHLSSSSDSSLVTSLLDPSNITAFGWAFSSKHAKHKSSADFFVFRNANKGGNKLRNESRKYTFAMVARCVNGESRAMLASGIPPGSIDATEMSLSFGSLFNLCCSSNLQSTFSTPGSGSTYTNTSRHSSLKPSLRIPVLEMRHEVIAWILLYNGTSRPCRQKMDMYP